MNVSDCYYLGIIHKVFGYKGDVVVSLDVDDPGDYKEMESVFVLINNKLVPFFIERMSLRPNSSQFVVHFQGVDNEEKANDLCGHEIYRPLSLLPPLRGNQFYFHEVTGFSVMDANHGHIGTIEEIVDLPGNPLLQIRYGNKEIMVPLRDEFIVKLDREARTIFIKAPEGLIDMYLTD
jgi:16S rRNA processing protein RimM